MRVANMGHGFELNGQMGRFGHDRLLGPMVNQILLLLSVMESMVDQVLLLLSVIHFQE